MDIEKGTTGQQRTEKGQQDIEEGGKSGKKGKYAETPIAQKDYPTEQQGTQPVEGISEARGARGDNYSKTNLDTSPSQVNASVQPFLGRTRRPAPGTSTLQAFPMIENNNHPLPTHLSTDQELSEYDAKVVSKEEEFIAANVRFEILLYHFDSHSLTKELQGCYREDPAGVLDEIREKLEDIAAAIRSSNPVVGADVPNRNSSVAVGKPCEARPTKSVSFTNLPEPRREHLFSTEMSRVKAEKAKMSVFSELIRYTSFLQYFFKRGQCSSQSSPQSAGSGTETTCPTNPQKPPFEKSDKANNNQQASEDDGAAIVALRELARTTLRQNHLILSKLKHRQQPVTSSSTSSRSQPPLSVSPFVPPTEPPTISKIPLIFLYTANTVLFITFLVAIAWALAAGLMADREREMWLKGGETARMASLLLQPEGGFWEEGCGARARGCGLGWNVQEGYF